MSTNIAVLRMPWGDDGAFGLACRLSLDDERERGLPWPPRLVGAAVPVLFATGIIVSNAK